jgi:uncharacterized LabA/DUF88 family protein
MDSTYLFIDGENFLFKIEDALIQDGFIKDKIDSIHIDIVKLLKLALPNEIINQSFFYAGRLREYQEYPETIKKSKELILKQRILKTSLGKQGFTFVLAGNVRPQTVTFNGKSRITFKEKGVDVRIAVDLISLSCDKTIKKAIICSSDSDLQPAIAEARKRGVEVVYLGFENSPNKGLMYTTNKTILFRNSEIKQCVPILSK